MEKAKLMTAILVLALAGVGCSKKGSSNSSSDESGAVDTYVPPVVLPPGGTGGSSSATGTNTVDFVPVSLEEMNNYVATHPLNAPSNFKLTVDLKADNEYRYSGSVKIAYDDAGSRYEGVFQSGSGVNSNLDYSNSNGLKEYVYNVWFNNQYTGGKTVFSGFFQDPYGGIVLVVDNVVNQGDGQGGSYVSGSIWYRNFANVLAPQGPERKCWYITKGPYDCRSTPVIYKTGIEPTDTYRKLGTFSGLLKSKAFR